MELKSTNAGGLRMTKFKGWCFSGLFLSTLVLLSLPTFAIDEKNLLGEWHCKVGGNKDHYDIFDNGTYRKDSILYGKDLTDKGFWEIRGNKLYLARMIHIANGKESKTDIIFIRQIVKLNTDKLELRHDGGLGNVVKTSCARKSWWSLF